MQGNNEWKKKISQLISVVVLIINLMFIACVFLIFSFLLLIHSNNPLLVCHSHSHSPLGVPFALASTIIIVAETVQKLSQQLTGLMAHLAAVEARDLVQFVTMSIFAILSVICVLFHIIKSYRAFHKPQSELIWKWNSVLSYSFLLLFIGFSYIMINEFLSTYMAINGKLTYPMCTFWFYFNIITYSIFKLIMYFTLITRLIEAFNQATKFYSCTHNFYMIWRMFLFFSMTGYCYFCLHFAEIDAVQIGMGKCRVALPINISMTAIGYDFFVCAVNLYLFINPLRKLSKGVQIDSSRDISKCTAATELQKIYTKLIKKNAILASVSILTTIGSWIVIAVLKDIIHIPATWTALDCIITLYCIVLLFTWNEREFEILCCCCIKWKDNVNNKQKQRETVLEMIQTTSNTVSNVNTGASSTSSGINNAEA